MRQSVPKPAAKSAPKSTPEIVTANSVVKGSLPTDPVAEIRAALEQQITEMQSKLNALTEREAALTEAERLHAKNVAEQNAVFAEREAAILAREKQQELRDQTFESDYAERVAELHSATDAVNKKVAELNSQVGELAEVQGQLTQREVRLTARDARSVGRYSFVASATPREETMPLPTSRAPKSWYEKHYFVVSDSRVDTWVYSEDTKKEMNTGEAKIAYLKRVMCEVPEDVSESNFSSMLNRIRENRELSKDPLFALKINLLCTVTRYLTDSDRKEDVRLFFSRLFGPALVSSNEEKNRLMGMHAAFLSSFKNEDERTVLAALHATLVHAEHLSDAKKWKFSDGFVACLEACKDSVRTYQPCATTVCDDVFGY